MTFHDRLVERAGIVPRLGLMNPFRTRIEGVFEGGFDDDSAIVLQPTNGYVRDPGIMRGKQHAL